MQPQVCTARKVRYQQRTAASVFALAILQNLVCYEFGIQLKNHKLVVITALVGTFEAGHQPDPPADVNSSER